MYEERSLQASENVVLIMEQTIHEIKNQPNHFRKVYKNYREAKTKKYPFSIVYFVDENKQAVIITTLFHQKRNPKNKFK